MFTDEFHGFTKDISPENLALENLYLQRILTCYMLKLSPSENIQIINPEWKVVHSEGRTFAAH